MQLSHWPLNPLEQKIEEKEGSVPGAPGGGFEKTGNLILRRHWGGRSCKVTAQQPIKPLLISGELGELKRLERSCKQYEKKKKKIERNGGRPVVGEVTAGVCPAHNRWKKMAALKNPQTFFEGKPGRRSGDAIHSYEK